MTDDLASLVARARAAYEAMTPQEREAMHRAQRTSYARAEMGFGSDADEAEFREAILSDDQAKIEACRRKETDRMALIADHLND